MGRANELLARLGEHASGPDLARRMLQDALLELVRDQAEKIYASSEPPLDPATVAAGRHLLAGRAVSARAYSLLAEQGVYDPDYEQLVSALGTAQQELAVAGLDYDQEARVRS